MQMHFKMSLFDSYNTLFLFPGRGEVNGRRVTEDGSIEFVGIGPTTPEGVPIATKPVRFCK